MNTEQEIVEKKPEEMLDVMNNEFKLDILNNLLAITVKRLMDFKKTVAIKYLTLDKYSNKDIDRVFQISKEDISSLDNDNSVYNKLRILCILEDKVLNIEPSKRTNFSQIKALQINKDFVKNKIIDISDDYQNLRVIVKLLERRPVEAKEQD